MAGYKAKEAQGFYSCCKCGKKRTELHATTGDHPLGRLLCPQCFHTGCARCEIWGDGIRRVDEMVREVPPAEAQARYYGFFCPYCGLSQTVKPKAEMTLDGSRATLDYRKEGCPVCRARVVEKTLKFRFAHDAGRAAAVAAQELSTAPRAGPPPLMRRLSDGLQRANALRPVKAVAHGFKRAFSGERSRPAESERAAQPVTADPYGPRGHASRAGPERNEEGRHSPTPLEAWLAICYQRAQDEQRRDMTHGVRSPYAKK